MTGTAMTEANEFWKIYKLDVVAIPTNKPLLKRVNAPDLVYKSDGDKWNAVVEEVVDRQQIRPADPHRHHGRGQEREALRAC